MNAPFSPLKQTLDHADDPADRTFKWKSVWYNAVDGLQLFSATFRSCRCKICWWIDAFNMKQMIYPHESISQFTGLQLPRPCLSLWFVFSLKIRTQPSNWQFSNCQNEVSQRRWQNAGKSRLFRSISAVKVLQSQAVAIFRYCHGQADACRC